jgi:hypothetical protein
METCVNSDLDTITSILHQTFELPPPFKRDYDSAFEKVTDILKRNGIVEGAHNLRFRFILCISTYDRHAVYPYLESSA